MRNAGAPAPGVSTPGISTPGVAAPGVATPGALGEFSQASLVPDGEYVMTERDFSRIASILEREAGIALPRAKATMAYSRLAKRLRALRLKNFAEYCELVAGADAGPERQHMIQALTTNLTHFFREPHHFEHLKQTMLPELMKQARQGKRVRLWSAGCSTGQEPYSIALTLLSVMPDAAQFDVKILATDIDRNVLAVGQSGIYEADQLAPVPPDLLQRWFVPLPGTSAFQAADTVRDLIAFRPLNLIGEWPMREKFQIIFCRNVVIYFSAGTQEQFWSRLTARVAPGGALYIGHSERITGAAETGFRSDGVTVYRNLNLAGAAS